MGRMLRESSKPIIPAVESPDATAIGIALNERLRGASAARAG
jgi:hypothetical protein